MLNDPLSITINSIAYGPARIETDPNKAVYSTTDGNIKMTISHQAAANRTRHMIRVDQRKVAADPVSAQNAYKTLGVYIVFDVPDFGFTGTEVDQVVQGLKTWLSASNNTRVIAGES